jgi:aryl-alcohol dehydrogenase-like predicted oxidoreductase
LPKLVLGTAQFGAAYGATNTRGRLDDAEVRTLLEQAVAAGVTTFDTAADYGDAQLRLGHLAPSGSRFITKFSMPAADLEVDADAIFERSRRTLGVATLAGVLFHKLADLRDRRLPDALKTLRAARDKGLIERMGVSVYDGEDLRLALDAFSDLDVIQIPASVVDRRLLDDDRVAELHARGVAIHVRSAYLQGLLLADPEHLPPHFASLAPALVALGDLAQEIGVPITAVLLGFLRDHPLVDGVVVGAVRPDELSATLDAWATPIPSVSLGEVHVPAHILDPRTWPRT